MLVARPSNQTMPYEARLAAVDGCAAISEFQNWGPWRQCYRSFKEEAGGCVRTEQRAALAGSGQYAWSFDEVVILVTIPMAQVWSETSQRNLSGWCQQANLFGCGWRGARGVVAPLLAEIRHLCLSLIVVKRRL